ncbi:MAG: penicillin-binding protein 2 [Candidatus Limnocylindrales bacterium]
MSVIDYEGGAPRGGLLRRFVTFGLVIALVVSALSIRLFQLQVANGGYFTTVANDNRIVAQPIPSSRGLIYDRTGRLLVQNVPTFTVKIRPDDLPDAQRADVVARLSVLLGMSTTDINEIIDRNPGSRFELVRVATDVGENVARLIAEEHLELPGVQVDAEARREYVYGPLLAHVIGYEGAVSADDLKNLASAGYLNDDTLGKAGVEAVYEAQLRGSYGLEQIERDASGRPVRVLGVTRPAQAGDSLELTIDTQIQQDAEKALRWGLGLAGRKSGVIMVMNPQTGEILADVSLPTYDDNLFARGISSTDYAALVNNSAKPLLDHAIGEQYPPGSTYKLVAGTGSLSDGKITPHTVLQTHPFIAIGRFRYYENNRRGYGPQDIYTGFAHSADTFFYHLAAKLGIERLAYWARQFGFGSPTGIDLPGEAAGNVPDNAWKQEVFGQPIFTGDTFLAGIGQGYDTATPLQLLNAYAALANGGRLLQPQVVRRIVAPDGTVVRDFAPILTRNLTASAAALKAMRVAARTVVTSRHTHNLVDLPIVVSGKTGTAEFGRTNRLGEYLQKDDWFVAFVPKNPFKRAGDPGGFLAASRTDSDLAVIAFIYDSHSVGQSTTEIVKYFLQLHYGLNVDLRRPGDVRPVN